MKKKITNSYRRQSQLKLEKASGQEIFNETARFMISNKNRNSATRCEIEKFFRCTSQKATRLMSRMVNEGRLTKDQKNKDLYWLVTE